MDIKKREREICVYVEELNMKENVDFMCIILSDFELSVSDDDKVELKGFAA